VDEVTGFIQGTAEERHYQPFEHFNPDFRAIPVYHTTHRPIPIKPGADVFLSVAYPPEAGTPRPETLSVALTCTNGMLPESLRHRRHLCGHRGIPGVRDLPEHQAADPDGVPAAGAQRPVAADLASVAELSVPGQEGTFPGAPGSLYIPGVARSDSHPGHKKRIGGIEHLQDRPSDRLVGGVPVRGREVTMRLRQDHYVSTGDLFLSAPFWTAFSGATPPSTRSRT